MKTNLNIKKTILILLVSTFFTSCLTNVEEDNVIDIVDEEVDICTDITFAINVKPIIDANCIGCHGTGGNSPNLTSYALISASASSVKGAVVSGRMPQGGSLTQEEIDAIACWVDSGALDN